MMGGVTCPNCGKDNPDFLDNCQFCQTALRRESTLNIGENPTKKVTGDLEPILPDWLRDARQQGRDSAEEEAKKEATKPRIEAEEPLDLLAGLAFQAASDEDEVPDWLAAINPVEKKELAPSKPSEAEPPDFFAQFNQPVKESATPELGDITPNTQKDELTGWLPQAAEQPNESMSFDSGAAQDDNAWMNNLNAPAPQESAAWTEPAKPAEPEDLGWLHDLESSTKQQPATPSVDMGWTSNLDSGSTQPSGSQDDLSWLNNLGGTPAPSFDAPAQPASSQEDLSWLNNLGGTPAPSFDAPAQPTSSQEDLGWLNNLGGTPAPSFDAPAQPTSSQEDLSWLNNLGGTPAPSFDTPAQPASSQEDLDWLNNLGSTPAPSFDTPAQPASSQEDLGWLNNLVGTPAPSFDAPAQPASSQEDLGWLNNLGGTPASSFDTPAQPTSPQEDLGWLNNLGGTPAPSFDAPAQPTSSQEDLDWLNNMGGTPAPSFNEPVPSPFAQPENTDWLKDIDNQPASMSLLTPRQTAPLSEEAQDSMPDWLKSATVESSMPPLGATSMDWFASKEKPADDVPLRFDDAQEEFSAAPALDQSQGMPASVDQNIYATSDAAATPLSNQDIDSLFAVDMPDWLSQPESQADASSTPGGISSTESSDSLAPVNLPSWVQAMRPVEAAISEASAISPDQTTEKEGPLAGLRGVIPFAPIGSAQRPKPISLKLQATEEQQAGASLFEQILAGETTAHPLKTSPFVASQRILRWVLSGIFLVVLGTMILIGTRQMPVSAALPVAVSNVSNVVAIMPDGAQVLVVVDYEPSLSGEMEAVAGPLLDQMVTLKHPVFSFVSTSANGFALTERLMTNTKINIPMPDGLGYQLNSQYFNVGYLPGGSAGVHGFVEKPQVIMPSVKVNLFSDFAAVVVITDHAESGLVWIEQLELMKQSNPVLANQPLLVIASAQAGPLLQPYISSNQVAGMITGLSEAVRYEYVINSRLGIARSYWDAFGAGLFMAVLAIVLGSLWSLFTGIRARRAEAEQG